MTSTISWFEIPASDIERATKFYGAILGKEMAINEAMPGYKMAQFPAEDGVSGAVLQGEGYSPSSTGSVVYLNGGDDLQTVLDRVEAAGGQVSMAKIAIGENGFMAFFTDTEGNKVGLHSTS